MLGVTYKTAWFMAHRIRDAMAPLPGSEPPLGGDGFVVEADETELAPSRKTRPRPRAKNLKFVSLVERDGTGPLASITGAKGSIAIGSPPSAIRENVDEASTLHTDGAQMYEYTLAVEHHEAVNHNKEFARDGEHGERVHTNTAEGFFIDIQARAGRNLSAHERTAFQRYLAEFDFRMNYRVKLGYSDDMRADKALEGIAGKRLTYRRIGEAAHA